MEVDVNWKEIYKFKADNGNVNFPTKFCLGKILEKCNAIEHAEILFYKNVYEFSIDYNTIENLTC